MLFLSVKFLLIEFVSKNTYPGWLCQSVYLAGSCFVECCGYEPGIGRPPACVLLLTFKEREVNNSRDVRTH